MDAGEGLRVAGAGVGLGLLCILFGEGMAWVDREWSKMANVASDRSPSDPDASAEAIVPELAAANRPPALYQGKCRCRACRKRPTEPCSDFSGE
jgi:hypothetical protein